MIQSSSVFMDVEVLQWMWYAVLVVLFVALKFPDLIPYAFLKDKKSLDSCGGK